MPYRSRNSAGNRSINPNSEENLAIKSDGSRITAGASFDNMNPAGSPRTTQTGGMVNKVNGTNNVATAANNDAVANQQETFFGTDLNTNSDILLGVDMRSGTDSKIQESLALDAQLAAAMAQLAASTRQVYINNDVIPDNTSTDNNEITVGDIGDVSGASGGRKGSHSNRNSPPVIPGSAGVTESKRRWRSNDHDTGIGENPFNNMFNGVENNEGNGIESNVGAYDTGKNMSGYDSSNLIE